MTDGIEIFPEELVALYESFMRLPNGQYYAHVYVPETGEILREWFARSDLTPVGKALVLYDTH